MEDIHLTQALMTILKLGGSIMAEEYRLTDYLINYFFDRFLSNLPDYLSKSLFNTGTA